MEKYNEYLAAHVLNDKEIVTYRTLSRALKVHVNLAKQMLWEFHQRLNKKTPGSVQATFLLSGLAQGKLGAVTGKTEAQQENGDDTVMASSPPLPSSSMPAPLNEPEKEVPTRTILLVREEHLDKAKASFTKIRGIHVYSLQPEALGDFAALSDCNRKLYKLLREEDPLKNSEQYGTIQNAFVKRRSQKNPALAPVIKTTSAETKPKIEQSKPETKPAAKTASMKREGSDIAASFAKSSMKPKSKPVEQKKKEEEIVDTVMADMSDDDGDDGAEIEIEVKASDGKTKLDRQAELEAMMDVDDEPEESPAADLEPPAPEPELEAPAETVAVENGRRRGRRKVMKKKTVRDEEGYLVTKEEAVWESFSEDEPAPKKAKTAAAAHVAKKAGKPGQGNIMSFFAKK